MKYNFLIFTVLGLILYSCSSTSSYHSIVSHDSLNQNCPLDILMPGQTAKKEIDVIGNFEVFEKGADADCGWEKTLKQNKEHACEEGAEGVQFLTVTAPSNHNTCYQSQSNFYIYKK